jgi:hypothetical protein
MKTKLGKRKCAECKEQFQKERPLQFVCSPLCGQRYSAKQRKKNEEKERRELKRAMLTRGQWLQKLQDIFNLYIRYRDRELNCVSCGKYVEDIKGDASHYWPVKPYYGLRFNEDNVHRSCDECNTHLHGNLAEYQIRLVIKIGMERFKYLEKIRHIECRMTIPEIKEQIEIYRQKIKEIKK